MQISDRFHLVKNLTGYATDALQKLFQGRIAIPITSETRRIRTMMLVSTLAERVHLIKQLHKEGRSKTEIVQMTGASAKTVNQYIAMSESDIPLDKQTVRGREHEEAVDKLLLRAQRVRALREEGYSITAIVQRTGFTANVIRNYLSEDFSPVNAHYGKQREGKLEPFRDEVFQMRLEGVTYREINRRIQERGYSGTEDAIRGFLSKERRVQRDLLALTGGEPIEFIDKKWLIRLLYNPLDKVKGITEDQLAAIFTAYPLAASIIELVDEFRCILRSKAPLKLLTWMERAAGLKITQLNTFINGLKHDIDAVMNAIASDFSNGLAEGTVNKIKVIKRIMYGRCHFCLLRSKCLLLQNL